MSVSNVIETRRLVVTVGEYLDSVPVGNMDDENAPKTCPFSGRALLTDVALKRRCRDYHILRHGGEAGQEVFYRPARIIEKRLREHYEAEGLDPKKDREAAMATLLKKYWDLRVFGGVLEGGGWPGGNFTGPVQIPHMYTRIPVLLQDDTMVSSTTYLEEDAKRQGKVDGDAHGTPIARTWARHALFPGMAHVDAHLAAKTGMTEEDFQALLDALQNYGEHYHTCSKGRINTRILGWFEYADKMGRTPMRKLWARLRMVPKTDVPLEWEDWDVQLDGGNLPADVTYHEVLI